MRTTKNIKYKFVVILFLIAIVLPNAVQILNLEKGLTNNENREYTAVPKFNFKKPIASIGEYKNYYLENFGLKTALVNNYINLKANILNENPIPNRVVKGKEEWFFLGNNNNNVLNNSFGNDSFTEKELLNTITYLKGLKQYFNAKNIAFYVVIPPDKNNVYQEYLPYKLKQNATKLDALKTLLKQNAGIEIIDLTPTLKANKNEYPLYLKTDTHWNYYGAYFGYSHTVEAINKDGFNLKKVPLSDFELTNYDFEKGDLTKMINVIVKEPGISIKKKTLSNVALVSSSPMSLHFKNGTQNVKAIMYRDSYSNAWIPFFNESFAEIIYHKKYIVDKNEIDTFNPDLVIFEVIERNIDMFGKADIYKN
ncbi:alginate O-acetyltransferase AlgX-related protein [Lacinutrix chionoecetis]